MKELSAGELSVLCSNLARGCEKQYKAEESELFRQLADYFAAATPNVSDASLDQLACPVCKVPAWKFEKIEGRGTV